MDYIKQTLYKTSIENNTLRDKNSISCIHMMTNLIFEYPDVFFAVMFFYVNNTFLTPKPYH